MFFYYRFLGSICIEILSKSSNIHNYKRRVWSKLKLSNLTFFSEDIHCGLVSLATEMLQYFLLLRLHFKKRLWIVSWSLNIWFLAFEGNRISFLVKFILKFKLIYLIQKCLIYLIYSLKISVIVVEFQVVYSDKVFKDCFQQLQLKSQQRNI